MIQITCKGNSAICTRTERLTSGMVGLQCEFVFDGAWDGLARTAVFWAGNEKRDVLLQGAVCTVPWEVLKTAGYQLVIGVYGTNAEGTLVIPTVYAMCGGIASGADPSGDEGVEPTLPVWGQMQGMIGNLADLATASKDNLVDAINEAAKSGGGGGSAVELDTTLTQSGKAADAKAVGNALAEKQPKGDYLTQNELPDMTAYRTAEAQDVIDAGKQDTLIQSGAAVGQIAKITAVDDNGKPTAWQAVDMPSGGGGEVWRYLGKFETSEEVSSIVVSEDVDGNPFALKKVIVSGLIAANNAAFTGWMKMYDQNGAVVCDLPSAVAQNDGGTVVGRGFQVESWIIAGTYHPKIRLVSVNTGGSAYSLTTVSGSNGAFTNVDKVAAPEAITKLTGKSYSSTPWGAGSYLHVWGVYA